MRIVKIGDRYLNLEHVVYAKDKVAEHMGAAESGIRVFFAATITSHGAAQPGTVGLANIFFDGAEADEVRKLLDGLIH